MIQLPTTKTKRVSRFEDEITLIYGAPKVGKSTFCSQFEAPLFLDSESGLRNLETYNIPISNWQDAMDAYEALSKAKKAGELPYKTLIFDTINNFYLFCMEHVCKKNGISHPSDLDYGKGWSMVKIPFTNLMNAYKSLGLGIVYVAHASEKNIKTRRGEYTRYDAAIAGQAYELIVGSCDFVLYACIESDETGEKRILRTKPCEFWNAGDKTGNLPPEIPLDAKAFLEAYNKSIKETK